MTAPIATDTEIAAAIARTAVPATMVTLACGDYRILRGVFVVGDEVECTEFDCGHLTSTVTAAIDTAIV